MKRKLPSGYLIEDNRKPFEFLLEDQSRRGFVMADDAAQAERMLEKTLDELGWSVKEVNWK